jgi:hypothetical protein
MKTFIYLVVATVQAQFDYLSAPPAEFFDSFYYSDYNATDSDYGYSTYDYGNITDTADYDMYASSDNSTSNMANDFIADADYATPAEVEEPEYDAEEEVPDLAALGRRNTVAANKDLLALIDEALNAARYVQATQTTTPATTTTTANTGATTPAPAPVNTGVPFHCWTCNDASSITDCQNTGSNVECHAGDYGGCMVEMEVESGTLRKLRMGCKQPQACEMQKSVNFWDFLGDATLIAAREAYAPYNRFTVCKPETTYNSYQPRSKCTQCCTHDNCFNTNGYTNGGGTTTTWADVQANWGRTEWKSTL